jgi:hypothetical protein
VPLLHVAEDEGAGDGVTDLKKYLTDFFIPYNKNKDKSINNNKFYNNKVYRILLLEIKNIQKYFFRHP